MANNQNNELTKDKLNIADILYQDDELLVLQTTAYDSNTSGVLADVLQCQNKNSYGQFNLGLHVKDNPTQVLQNRCKLNDKVNQYLLTTTKDTPQLRQIHWLEQVHGNQVVHIDDAASATSENQTLNIKPKQADAMITSQKGCGLAIMTADCVPIVLSNKHTGQVAAIHAGWQGLANGVIAQTINAFASKQTNTKIEAEIDAGGYAGVDAWIGACISVDNYEVSREVCNKLVAGSIKNVFANSKKSVTHEELTKKISKPHKDDNKVWLDLQTLAKLQLQTLGYHVKSTNIPCSYKGHYYSYRRKTHLKQPNTGRMAMLVVKL